MAGYLPGILMGLAIMLVCAVIAKRRGWPLAERPTCAQALKALLDALPSLLLVIIVMGGYSWRHLYGYRSLSHCRDLHLHPVGADLS